MTVTETRIPTRWPDFDALGHLNHAIYEVMLDEAREDALRRTVGGFEVFPNVVVHTSVDYRSEIPHGTREIVVRTEITSVGGSSVRFRQQVLLPEGTLAAESESVVAAWDPATRRSRAITGSERAALT